MVYREIFNDWKGAFPFLKEYTKSTLYLRAGIVMIGLRFQCNVWGDSSYQVYLECVSLWKNYNGINRFNLFFKELIKPNGISQFFINFKSQDDFLKAVMCANAQFGELLQSNIKLSDLFNLINSMTGSFLTRHNPNDYINLFEFELALALFLNDPSLETRIKRQIDLESTNWDNNSFFHSYGITIEEWKQDLYERMSDREALMAQVEKNLESRRIRNLNEAQFVIDDFVLDSEQPKSMSRRWKEFRENFRNTRIGLWRQLIAKIKGEEYP